MTNSPMRTTLRCQVWRPTMRQLVKRACAVGHNLLKSAKATCGHTTTLRDPHAAVVLPSGPRPLRARRKYATMYLVRAQGSGAGWLLGTSMTPPRQSRTRTQRQSHTDLWMRRRQFISLVGRLAIAWPVASCAQQPKQPLKRVGGLAPIPCPLQPDNLAVRRLAELGWIEGQNIVFDCVSTVGRVDQVPAL